MQNNVLSIGVMRVVPSRIRFLVWFWYNHNLFSLDCEDINVIFFLYIACCLSFNTPYLLGFFFRETNKITRNRLQKPYVEIHVLKKVEFA